ncbi:extracellular solute-binding protein [Chloroflexus sp.]|uniref:extracellular solute-binding protein n=1 Tax=Chloroflexus sp. TaxID=1904827 RepID=UPI00298F3508|nr:extracellular solute-binding protein [Chloroflexus sp.]MCS6889354.1 extracellular solute-binding protein [Chloroflexus sp.]MDW8402970.1 extracellular solute-binding protein [Chloroflexus sp.]
MSLSIARAAALIGVAALICAACAAPAPAPTATPAPTAAPTATTAPTATAMPTATPLPTATPVARQLTVWVAEPADAQAAIATELQQAAQANQLQLAIIPRDPDGLLLSLATDRLLGLPPPDLIWADQEALVGLLADSALAPLDIHLPEDLLPGLRVIASSDNTLWGAPITAQDMLLLLYQLDRAPPATAADLVAAAQAARAPERAGFVQGWGAARWLAPWFYAAGGSFTTPDGAAPTLDTPAMTATLTLLRDLYQAAPRNGDSYARGQRLLAQGFAAYAIDGDWAWPTYRAISDTFQIGIAPLPTFNGSPARPLIGGSLLMRHRDGQATPADVAALVAALYQPAAQLRLSAALGRLPARRELLADPALQADPARAAAAIHAAAAPGLPPTPAARCAIFGVESYLYSVTTGDLAINEAPARMQREALACLRQYPQP